MIGGGPPPQSKVNRFQIVMSESSQVVDMMNFLTLSTFDGILLDIDNTLYDYDAAHDIAINLLAGDLVAAKVINVSVKVFKSDYREARTRITSLHKGSGSTRSRLLALQAVFETYALPKSYQLARDYEDHYWASLIANMTPNSALIDLLTQFHRLGRPICTLTDMQARFQVAKLEGLGMVGIVDFMVSSEEVGCEKPDRMMFEAGLRKLNLSEDKVLMIGDSEAKDIAGAHAMGIMTWQITDYI